MKPNHLATTTRAASKHHVAIRTDMSAFLATLRDHEQRYHTVAHALADAALAETVPAKRSQFHTLKTLIDGATTRLAEIRRATMELGQIMHDVDGLADHLEAVDAIALAAPTPPA